MSGSLMVFETVSSLLKIDEETKRHVRQLEKLRQLFNLQSCRVLRGFLCGCGRIVPFSLLACGVLVLSFFPVGIWVLVLFFGGMFFGGLGFTEFFASTRNVIPAAPLSERGKTLFRCLRSHTLAAKFVLFTTFFLVIPHTLLARGESVTSGLMMWVALAVFSYAMILFSLHLLVLVVVVAPWYLRKHFRSAERVLPRVVGILFLALFFQMFFSLIAFAGDLEGAIRFYSWFPLTAPFVLPMNETLVLLTEWELTLPVLAKLMVMVLAYVSTTLIYLNLEFGKVENPQLPSPWSIRKKLESINTISQERAGERGASLRDLRHFARVNVRNARALQEFRFGKGARVLESLFRYSELKESTHTWNAYRVMGAALFFLVLILVGVYLPHLFFVLFGSALLLALFSYENTEEKKYSNTGSAPASVTGYNVQPWPQVFRLIPDTQENIRQVFQGRMTAVRNRRVGLVLLFHISALPFIFYFSYLEGTKIPIFRFLALFLCIVPLISLALSRLGLLFSGSGTLRNLVIICGGLALILFNAGFLMLFFMFRYTNPGYALLFGVNLGVLFCGHHAREDIFDTIFNRVVDRTKRQRILLSRLGLVVIVLISAFSLYRLISFHDFVEFSSLPGRDEANYHGNVSGQYVEFTEDVIIDGNVSFENCTLFFADDYFSDILLYVPEDAALTIRNATLDANYRFHFWVAGDLVLDNVTIDKLYGSRYSFRFFGGIIIWGEASISHTTIMNSGAMGIQLSKGNLTLRDSRITGSHNDGIEAHSSILVVENCTFRDNGNKDIALDDCNASIVNCSFVGEPEEAIAYDDDSSVFKSANQFHRDEEDDLPVLAVVNWTGLIILLLVSPGICGKFMNDTEWRKLYEQYGIWNKKRPR